MDVMTSVGELEEGAQEQDSDAAAVAAVCPNGDGSDLLACSGCCAREI
jgi:hypothetical protein